MLALSTVCGDLPIVCGGDDDYAFVERVSNLLPQALKDSLNSAEDSGDDASVTVPGVSYGERGTSTLKYTFTLDHPATFAAIRATLGIREELFRGSLCGHRAIKGGVVGAGSDALFFFSKDRKVTVARKTPFRIISVLCWACAPAAGRKLDCMRDPGPICRGARWPVRGEARAAVRAGGAGPRAGLVPRPPWGRRGRRRPHPPAALPRTRLPPPRGPPAGAPPGRRLACHVFEEWKVEGATMFCALLPK